MLKYLQRDTFICSYVSDSIFFFHLTKQEDRERLVIRRFKFEEPRPEQIQDLEVGTFLLYKSLVLDFHALRLF